MKFKIKLFQLFKIKNKICNYFYPFVYDKNINQKEFTVLITAFNNLKYVENCISSVLQQKYSNYKIIYIDDASTDGSDLIAGKLITDKVILNKKRVGKLANLYREIHKLDDNSIILELDGDDYLMDQHVLTRFNYMYQKFDCLVVHANYKNFPIKLDKQLKLGHFSQETPFFIKKKCKFRCFPWIYSGLRSYQISIFKQIKIDDLLCKFDPYKNKFLPVFHDAAVFYPILEMAGEKIGYIAEPMLQRNIDSDINDFKVYDEKIKQLVRKQILNSISYEKLI